MRLRTLIQFIINSITHLNMNSEGTRLPTDLSLRKHPATCLIV